jgi:hypothetical protein
VFQLPSSDCGDSDVVALARVAHGRLGRDPRDSDALFVLAASLLNCGHLADAARTLDRLVAVDRRYPGVWLLKRTVLEALGDHRGAEACMALARSHQNG